MARSKTERNPQITILPELTQQAMQSLRAQSRKDIWLFGGGAIFALLLALGEVDTVEVSLIPVLLGGGIPLLPPSPRRTGLTLSTHRVYPSGRVHLVYDVQQDGAASGSGGSF